MIMFSIILLIGLISIVAAGVPTAVVNTTTGPVQGQILETVINSVKYAAFTGIRFGKAPVGYLRFKPPVPVDPWTEILNATSPGSECPQMDPLTKKFRGSEDCLFLSVYTPVVMPIFIQTNSSIKELKTNLAEPPSKLKAVMVWIYGGEFLRGSQADPRHHPDYLLERDVVYVPINYRIGALGFLCLNHPNATGNAGLKDQVLALKWIQANIEAFGGNPKNVTLFGQSVGAVSAGFHVLSEVSAGLFHGVIAMSGTPLVPWGFTLPAVAENRAVDLGAILGISTDDKNLLLERLYAASPEELVKHARNINPVAPFTPTLEDSSIASDIFISKCSVRKYIDGNFTKVPQILGFMEMETISFLSCMYTRNAIPPIEAEKDTIVIFDTNIPGFSDIVDRAIDIFPSDTLSVMKDGLQSATDVIPPAFGDSAINAVVSETTVLVFKAQIDTTQRLLAAKNDGKPIYYYYTTFATNTSLHNIEDNITNEGAGHSDDLAYIFYMPHANYSHNLSDPTALTIYRVTTMWTNFAKYGNPTPDWIDEYPLGITWPTSGCEGTVLNIGYDLTIESRPIGLNTQGIETANNLILGTQNGCSFTAGMPNCDNSVFPLLSILAHAG